MIHHPLVATAAGAIGLGAAFAYARWQRMPITDAADALAAPVAVGLACEQLGALMAGSGFGSKPRALGGHLHSSTRRALERRAAGRSAASGAGLCGHRISYSRRPAAGDVCRRGGSTATRPELALIGFGAIIFVTEFWRDWEGRGAMLHGALDGPQLAALLLLMAGALLLRERRGAAIAAPAEAAHG